MEYLTDVATVDDLERNKEIGQGGEILLLHSPAGKIMTYINEGDGDIDDDLDVDPDATVFAKQRWLVTVLPKDRFSRKFKTHRYIHVYYSTYQELSKDQERIYTSYDVMPHNDIDTNKLGDDFSDLF